MKFGTGGMPPLPPKINEALASRNKNNSNDERKLVIKD